MSEEDTAFREMMTEVLSQAEKRDKRIRDAMKEADIPTDLISAIAILGIAAQIFGSANAPIEGTVEFFTKMLKISAAVYSTGPGEEIDTEKIAEAANASVEDIEAAVAALQRKKKEVVH